MLTLKKIKLVNFLSHSDTELDIEDQAKLLLSGNSGSGKSAIVEGLLWCLFGKGRTDNRAMIKRGANNASVTVLLLDGEEKYEITREVSTKGKQTLSVDKTSIIGGPQPVSKTGLKDMQEYIEKELLRSSYTLFVNSVVYPQDTTESFVKQTAGKRKEMLLEIVGAEDYDTYYNRAKSLASVTSESITRLTAELEMLNKSREESTFASSKLAEYQAKEKELQAELLKTEELIKKEAETKEALSSIQNKITLYDAQTESKMSECKKLETRIETLKYADQNSLPQFTKEEIEEQLMDLALAESEAEALINAERAETTRKGQLMAIMADKPRETDYESEIESLKKQMARITEGVDNFCVDLGKPCPRLQKQLDDQTEYYRSQIEQKETDKLMQGMALDEYTKKLETVGPAIEFDALKLMDLRTKIVSLSKYKLEQEKLLMFDSAKIKRAEEISSLELELAISTKQFNEYFAELTKLKLDRSVLAESNVGTTDHAVAANFMRTELSEVTLQRTMAELAAAKALELDTKISEKEEKQSADTEKFEDLLLVKEAFGSTGIKSVVIDYILPGLEEKINQTLSKLSSFKVTLDTQRKSLTDDKMIEGLFINIFDEQGNLFDYDSFSGGQKNRIAYALFEGLASIQKCNFRIFDESIAGLDEETVNSFADVMLQMNQEEKQILCISHIQNIKDIFEDKVEIINVGGDSRIQ